MPARPGKRKEQPITTAFRASNWEIPIGIPVFTADEHRLGVVTQADAYELLVEEGFFVHHTYAINLFDVERYEQNRLVLKLTAAEAVEQRAVG